MRKVREPNARPALYPNALLNLRSIRCFCRITLQKSVCRLVADGVQTYGQTEKMLYDHICTRVPFDGILAFNVVSGEAPKTICGPSGMTRTAWQGRTGLWKLAVS